MIHTVLCADIGTTSLKAAVIDSTGEVVSFSRQAFSVKDSQYASKAWIPALCDAIAELKKTNSDGIRAVEAVSISGNGPTVVAESGRTLLWNVPLRNASPSESLFIPRLAAFKSLFPDDWKTSAYIYSGPEYLVWRLTGNAVTVLPEERYRSSYWTEESLKKAEIEKEKLPPYIQPTVPVGIIFPDMADLLEVPQGVPVICGGPDFIAAMVGTNSLEEGKLYDCAGSSEGVNLVTAKPLNVPGVLVLPSVIPELWNAAVMFTESGRIFLNYKIIMEAIAEKELSYSYLISQCIDNPRSDGYDVLLYLAQNVKTALGILKSSAAAQALPVAPLMAVTGGQAKNPRWMQMKADIAGIQLSVCLSADAELIGDAVFAQTALGKYKTLKEAADSIVKISEIYTPKQTGKA